MADDTLAASVARVYFANCRIVRALGREYGFRSVFFWQPVIWVGKKPLTPDEVVFRSATAPDMVALAGLFRATYPRVEQDASREGVHSLTDVFDNQRSPIWIDVMHVVPLGNRLVAQRMLRELEGEGVAGRVMSRN
jgi:hypothetical protein